jgi:predicted RNase H-like nuclease (RuvC/YqgF family)
MQDDLNLPTSAELERFREDITRELRLTRDEVRQAFEAAAEPLKVQLPEMLKHIAMLEERVRELEAKIASDQWQRQQIN